MITFTTSASKLNTMDSCWEKYNLEYNRRWAPNTKAPALEHGDLIHLFFAHYYRAKLQRRWMKDESQHGIVLDEATNLCRARAVDMDISVADTDEDIRTAREALLFHYRDGMEVYAVEEPFTRILYETPDTVDSTTKQEIHGIRILFEGRVDLIAKLPNSPFAVWDHKSESRKSDPSKMSNQFEGSAWAFGVKDVIINKVGFQVTKEPKEKFRRIFLNYSDKELIEEWRRDTIEKTLEAIERHRRESRGNPRWPRNRTSCDKYSGCVYRQVCETKPTTRNVKLMTWYHIRPEYELYEQDGIDIQNRSQDTREPEPVEG